MASCQENRFYIVWSPQGTTPPKKIHGTKTEANLAAADMAKKNPGMKFYVLLSVEGFVMSEMTRIDLI